jgi:hypothetical protein
MSRDENPISQPGEPSLWKAVGHELLEIAWLASAVGALSAAGVGLAVLLAGA